MNSTPIKTILAWLTSRSIYRLRAEKSNLMAKLFAVIVFVLVVVLSTQFGPVKDSIHKVQVHMDQAASQSTMSASPMVNNNGPLNQWWDSMTDAANGGH